METSRGFTRTRGGPPPRGGRLAGRRRRRRLHVGESRGRCAGGGGRPQREGTLVTVRGEAPPHPHGEIRAQEPQRREQRGELPRDGRGDGHEHHEADEQPREWSPYGDHRLWFDVIAVVDRSQSGRNTGSVSGDALPQYLLRPHPQHDRHDRDRRNLVPRRRSTIRSAACSRSGCRSVPRWPRTRATGAGRRRKSCPGCPPKCEAIIASMAAITNQQTNEMA